MAVRRDKLAETLRDYEHVKERGGLQMLMGITS